MANRRNASGWWIQIADDPASLPLLERVHASGTPILLIDPSPRPAHEALASHTMRRSLADTEGIRDALRAFAPDQDLRTCATTVSDVDALRLAGLIREDHDLPGRDREGMEVFLARSAWKKVLADAAIPTPDSTILESPVELDRFLGVHPSALLRPATGGRGSAGVGRARIGDPRNRELFDEARAVSDSGLVRAEAFVGGEAHAIEGYVQGGRFVPLAIGRKFSMRHLRGTLPTGVAWGTDRAGTHARGSRRWAAYEALAQRVADALGDDDGFLSLDVLDDDDTTHVVDLRPHLGRAVERGLAFAGQDPVGVAHALAIGEAPALAPAGGDTTRGFAQRFCYATANGPLADPCAGLETGTSSASGAPGGRWETRALDEARVEIVLDRHFGEVVERPGRPEDRVASILVEAADRNTAWMRANEIEADAVFRVDEPKPEPRTTVPPIWPMAPPRS